MRGWVGLSPRIEKFKERAFCWAWQAMGCAAPVTYEVKNSRNQAVPCLASPHRDRRTDRSHRPRQEKLTYRSSHTRPGEEITNLLSVTGICVYIQSRTIINIFSTIYLSIFFAKYLHLYLNSSLLATPLVETIMVLGSNSLYQTFSH